jgi:Tfp pilus assembly protein PilF
VQTPHFLVLSNGNQREARDVGAGFEQIHAVFAQVLTKLRTDSGAQTIVLAVKDARSLAEVLPPDKKRADNIAGEFIKGWEKDYVAVRLDTVTESREVVYHEYIHKLLHLNFTRLPVWLDEGLAEFFGNTQFRKDQVLLGAPSPRVRLLQARAPYPLSIVLSASGDSPYYRDPDKNGMFYAEAWALTHFLMFGDGMGNGQQLNTYLVRLQQGADQGEAFQETFGNQKELEKRFFQYTGRFAFAAFVLGQSLKVDPAAFSGAPMTAADRDVMLGDIYTRVGEIELATTRLTAALAQDPHSALGHENMGFLYFRQGKDEEAKQEFDKAASLDVNSYLAAYYQAMLAYHGKPDPDSLAKLDRAMQVVLQLNPRFAPALIARSQIRVRQRNLNEALNFAVQAQKLEPDRGGYLTNEAAILLLGGKYADAAKIAALAAARWSNSDSAEALAVLNQARQRGAIPITPEELAQEALEIKYAEGTRAVEGVVKSTTCDKMKLKEVVLQANGTDQLFQVGKEFSGGFSDTLWYGEDHFSFCYHLQGMNALVRYKPAAGPTLPQELRGLEIRDEIIPSSASVSAN